MVDLLPDWQAVVHQWLTSRPGYTSAVPGGLWAAAYPATDKVFPLGRITLLDDSPVVMNHRRHVLAMFQFDFMGHSLSTVWAAADTTRAHLADIAGVHTVGVGKFAAAPGDIGGIAAAVTDEDVAGKEGTTGQTTSKKRHTRRFTATLILRPA